MINIPQKAILGLAILWSRDMLGPNSVVFIFSLLLLMFENRSGRSGFFSGCCARVLRQFCQKHLHLS
jgi:hypothetical protein